ncbi:MAG: hypothetical protein OEW82_01185 [Dehalococcoidia bacterium]|nr:hypothetical protein [Dehalococcoidia bacterium]
MKEVSNLISTHWAIVVAVLVVIAILSGFLLSGIADTGASTTHSNTLITK